jgi:glycosyltransferase involved in cell wall biosynthesis
MGRIVLVDPAAKDSTGHHVSILQRFARLFGEDRCYYAVNMDCADNVGLPPQRTLKIFEPTIYDLWQFRLYGRTTVRLERWFDNGKLIKDRDTRFMIREVLRQIRYGQTSIMRRARIVLGTILGVIALPYLAFRPYRNTTPEVSIFTSDLLQLIRRLSLGPDDHIVIPSAETELAAAAVALAVELDPERMPNIHLRFMYTNESLLTTHYDYDNLFMRLRATQLVGKRIHIYSETAAYAKILTRYFGQDIEDIPYPVDKIESAPKTGEKLVFGFLGAARDEKGFRRLGSILREFAVRHPDLIDRVIFRIQAGGSSRATDDLVESFKQETAELGLTIELVLGNISEARYESLRGSVDVFLLPYDPLLYGVRGSGVVFEAVGASRPFICSAGVSFEELNTHGNALSAADNIAFADAIRAMTLRYERYRKNAETAAEVLMERVRRNGLLDRCAPSQAAPRFVPPPKLLVVSPWYPSGGSETVFMAQLDAFRELGVQTTSIFMESTPVVLRDGSDDAKSFNRHANSGPVGYANAALSFKTYYSLRPKNWLNWFVSAAIYDRFLRVDTRARAAHELPSFVRRVAKQGRYDAILVNHMHQTGLAERIPGFSRKPKIIETHDIQSRQYEIRRGYLSPEELSYETAQIEKYDRIVWLNAREKSTFESISERRDSRLIHPAIGPRNWKPLDVWSTKRAFPDIIRSSEPAWQFSADTPALDMLFVGSRHPANTRALERLLFELLPESITRDHPLWIAGTVCEGMFPKYFRHNITPLHLVKDVDPLYAISKIVLVPYAGGTGIPTKLIDATSRRKAVLIEAAAMAALDLPDLDKYEIVTRSAREFTRKLEKALTDAEYRVRLADEGYELYHRFFAHAAYRDKWSEVLTSVGLKLTAPASLPQDDFRAAYTEHNSAVNWLFEELSSGNAPSRERIDRVMRGMSQREVADFRVIAAANGTELPAVEAALAAPVARGATAPDRRQKRGAIRKPASGRRAKTASKP